ncbi:MAG TPA: tetratricopeptide repeat protein, partial [Gemmataceae bacterium]|nr:tetratricopeptide repeat protein [Gemmataceae bacterium]
RRHPRLTSSGSVAAVAALLLLAAGAGVAGLREHLAHAEEQLTAVAARDQKQAFEAGVLQVLCLVNTTLESHDHLRAGVSACEKTLNIYGLLAGDSWQEPISWAQLAEEERHRLAEDARELLLLLAGARVRLSGGDPVVLQQALALLDRAEAIGGLEPSQALWRDRANYLEQLGENARAATARQRAESIPATSARDHYQLASTYARQGTSTGYAQAIAELNEALRLNPRHFWSCIQRGLCQQELGNLVQAAGDFGRCIGLWPEFAWSYFNRGYILDQNGQKTAAIDDYTAALERDPQFVPAYVNRGLAYLQCKQPARALADFQKAAALGKDDASLHASRGMALEALGRAAEADAAFDTAFGRAAVLPEPARLRLRWTYGFAVANRLPQKAREAFNAVLRQEPRHPQALYGRAFLAVQAEQAELALRFLDQALEADPNLVDARRTRALVLSRLGQLERASQDINWCLDHEPRQSATLYTAACVAARVAERYADAQAAEKALLLLQKALAQGAAADKVADDPDLAGLRAHPKFQQLIAQWSAARSRTESELHGDAK